MQTIIDVDSLRDAVSGLRASKKRIALVPTMGALHEGHLTLVREARRHADAVVVSIFVNPRQFGANEDLAAYPRQLANDADMLRSEAVELLWAPSSSAMYPDGYATNISVSGVSDWLCGAARPGHFDGVATVVCKLFNQVQPDVALFGEKDWQQLAVIRRMARDLDLLMPRADAILGVATAREADGLARSSRNVYLSADERARAAILPSAMQAARAAIESGSDVATALADLQNALIKGGFVSVDYTALANAQTLAPIAALGNVPARLLVAARMGKTRLIDNIAVGEAN